MSQPERTLVLVKPDAVERGLTGEILSRIERKGYQIVELSMLQASTRCSWNTMKSTKEKTSLSRS